MADNEGIRSPFSTQLSARSSKLGIYRGLFLFNQGVDQLVALLRNMVKSFFANKESVQSAIVEIEEIRCGMNADFTERVAERERFDEGHFWKQRRTFEKKWRDPDDVYIDVERREQERTKQGLPPRLGVLPRSAVAKDEERWEAEQERKKRRDRKPRNNGTKPRNAGRKKAHD